MPVFSLSSFQMTLRVGVGWVNYSDWQLKLTNQDGDEAYVALAIDDEVSGSYLGGTITYDATLAPALTFVPDEAWLVNDEILSGNWAGLQLMLTLY